jgi:outer membrane protein OmpU
MKKVLFATTALIATAGVAAADVTVSGYAESIFKNTGANGTDSHLVSVVEFDVAFSGTTDGGLAFGATMDLDASGANSDPEIFISGGFGRLNLGAIAQGGDNIGLAEVGDGVGIDDTLEGLRTGVAADIGYSYTIDGLTINLTTNVGATSALESGDEGDFGMGITYKMGDLTIEAGYGDDNQSGDSWSGIEVSYTMGAASFGATMISRDEAVGSTARDRSGFGASIGYAVNDALTVTGVYASVENATAGVADRDDYGLGFAYKLGGGATIVGGMGETGNLDAWDFGIQMSF